MQLAVSFYSATMYVQTALSKLLWYWRKHKNITIFKQVLDFKAVMFFYDFQANYLTFFQNECDMISWSVNHDYLRMCPDLTSLWLQEGVKECELM